MPELPEVETIRSGLAPKLPGRRIHRVTIDAPKLAASHTGKPLEEELPGQAYTAVRRLGKILIIDLERFTLLVRLGMTGQLTFRDLSLPDDNEFSVHPVTGLQRTASQHSPDKHTHIIAEHEDGTMLCYRDIRMFGHWILYDRAQADKAPELLALGPDPVATAPDMLAAHLRSKLGKTARCIKTVLLDQAIICGLGNIYADEALYLSHIRPDRAAKSLTAAEVEALSQVIPPMLQRSIANRGTTFSDYRDSEGNPGHNQDSLQVYGRYGSACYGCGTTLERLTLGGRTTSWCPNCQH